LLDGRQPVHFDAGCSMLGDLYEKAIS